MESSPQEDAEGQAIVKVLAVVLERLVSANSHLDASQVDETKFHALRAPAIGIHQYLERIHKYASCSKECFILALIYIDRLIQRNNFLLTSLNVHRVVITAVLLAAKFFDDAYYNNAYYAKVGGVLVSEMNTLEVEFLFKIDFSLRVLPEVFDKYRDELIGHSSSVGMDAIENSTMEDLVRGTPLEASYLRGRMASSAAQQQQQQCAAVPQVQAAPLLQTYSQTDLDVAMCATEGTTATSTSHYPIGALHQSLTAAAVPQAQMKTQQQQTAAPLEVFPFPALAPEVSVQQQSQVPPSQHPSELNLVYHNTTNHAVTPAAAVPQDDLSQYTNQALHITVTTSVPPQASQSQVYPNMNQYQQQTNEFDSAYYSAPAANNAPVSQDQVVYTQNTNYFNNNGITTTSHHPEITPSPPPQPPMNIHGAPMAYNHVDMGIGMGLHLATATSNMVSSLKPATASTTTTNHHHHFQQQGQHHHDYLTDAHHYHPQMPTITQPIAIQSTRQNCNSQYIPQDTAIGGSWTSRFSFGRDGINAGTPE